MTEGKFDTLVASSFQGRWQFASRPAVFAGFETC